MIDKTVPNAENFPAALILADGRVFQGFGIGKKAKIFGEICFNTAITGYQEILTDPSYAGQIITFTFPHIGNVGVNNEDIECDMVWAKGLVIRADITNPSNYRATGHFHKWLLKNNLTGICGIDTRALTCHIRENGAQNACIVEIGGQRSEVRKILEELRDYPSMVGLDLAKEVTCKKSYEWRSEVRDQGSGIHVVAIDYGVKQNILRCLVAAGCKVTVVPANAGAKEILKYKPSGIFLSNGPGDPAATGEYTIPVIKELMETGIPIFGVCLGHQLLALAMGCKTEKMLQGHHGANHPVKDLETGKVEITSQNHGFVVSKEPLPKDVVITHISLFDNTIQGIKSKSKPIFSVQGHPEASPGPQDSLYLFERFKGMMKGSEVRGQRSGGML